MIPVILFSTLFTIINLLPVLIGAFKTPVGSSYLWTGHYYADYFYYLQIMAQGKWGNWQIKNYYATDDPTTTLLGWWPDLLLGKIAGGFHIPLVFFYWLGIAVFSILLCLLIYLVIEKMLAGKTLGMKLTAFVLTLFAGSFPGFSFWSAPNSIFERFGGINRHLIDQIAVLMVVLVIIKFTDLPKYKMLKTKYFFVVGILISLLLTFSPQLSILTFASIFVTLIFFLKSKSVIPLLTLTIPFVFFFFLVRKFSPEFGIIARGTVWNVMKQVWTTPLLFIGSLGPLMLIAPFGIKKYSQSLTSVRLIFLVFLLLSFGLFFSPIPAMFSTTNIRFLVSLIYLPLGVMGVLGIEQISKFLPTYHRLLFVVITALVLGISVFSNFGFLRVRLSDPNLNNKLSYLSDDWQKGLKILDQQAGYKGNVLTGPYSDLGVILPVFVNRTVYFGMSLITPNYESKRVESANFFRGVLKSQEASNFLAKNNLVYVVWTNWDGERNLLEKYPFLGPIYLSPTMVVYKVTSN